MFAKRRLALLEYQIFSRQQNRQSQMADDELMSELPTTGGEAGVEAAAEVELIFSDALVFLCLLLFVKLDKNNDVLGLIGFEVNREEREEFERREREVREENEFKEHVEKIVGVKILPKLLNRLYMLHQLIAAGETIEHMEKDENSPLGFSEIRVKQPDFNTAIREMLQREIWYEQRSLKLPTWSVYERMAVFSSSVTTFFRHPKPRFFVTTFFRHP
jgi:hypothetical protein